MELIQAKYEKAIQYCNSKIKSEYFEFSFSYVSMDERFRELDRFIWEARHQCTRYKNCYSGDIVIDISEWSDKEPNEYFDAFMYYIKDIYSKHHCIFISEKICDKGIIDRIHEHFEITVQTLDIKLGTSKKLNQIGFAVSKEEHEYV